MTTPVTLKREWVELTEKELLELQLSAGIITWRRLSGKNFELHVDDGMDGDAASLAQFARLIQLKLKEKNNG